MTQPSPENIELARRKIAQAARLIDEVCRLIGADPRVISFHRIKSDQRPATSVREPSHTPARHPETPLPTPPRSSPYHCDPVAFEHDRRERAAKKWSEQTNHDPALHHAFCCHVRQKTLHHSECISNSAGVGFGKCDCGPVFLKQFAGLTFAVMADGTLERFVTPDPRPAEFRTNERDFLYDLSWDASEWVLPLIADALEFSTSGYGESERFLELPHASDIETRKAPDL